MPPFFFYPTLWKRADASAGPQRGGSRLPKRRDPLVESKREAKKLANPNTRKKNFAGQTNGQWEQDPKGRSGQFTGAGEAPIMKK